MTFDGVPAETDGDDAETDGDETSLFLWPAQLHGAPDVANDNNTKEVYSRERAIRCAPVFRHLVAAYVDDAPEPSTGASIIDILKAPVPKDTTCAQKRSR